MPSQLKKLRASLREQGVIGPQKSKKQIKSERQSSGGQAKRLDKRAALGGIREQFNPFDLKHNARGPKFDVTSNRPPTGNAAKGIQGRPTEARSTGEERRRQALLADISRKHKVGGIIDKRFGENDPTMDPDQKMLERYALEKQKNHKRAVFDLEDDDDQGGFSLTHMGKALHFDGPTIRDDFEEEEEGEDEDMEDESPTDKEGRLAYLKRKQLAEVAQENNLEESQRKKSKKEAMEEVISKSKFHKYERQIAKEDDDDLRAELDKTLPDLRELLFQGAAKPKPINSTSTDEDKKKLEKEYDLNIKQLAKDRRAAPGDKTLTDQEQAQAEAERLKEVEEKRERRMAGLEESETEDEEKDNEGPEYAELSAGGTGVQFREDDMEDYGLGVGLTAKAKPTAAELGFDDEDDFLIEDDLVASSASDLSENEEDDDDDDDDDDYAEDDEFTKGLLNEEESNSLVFTLPDETKGDGSIACPNTHDEFINMTNHLPLETIPTRVQRIRAQYHPRLAAENKSKLAKFSTVLIKHLPYLTSQPSPSHFALIETLTRHVHSLAKSYPIEVANEFRSHLEDIGQNRPLALGIGDLTILTAIGSVYPTSDHFHQVVTPAILVMARFLGQKIARTTDDFARGAYAATLALQYQATSKRHVPELINWALYSLSALAPVKAKTFLGSFPQHNPPPGMRIEGATSIQPRKLNYSDLVALGRPSSPLPPLSPLPSSSPSPSSSPLPSSSLGNAQILSQKVAIVSTMIRVLDAAADTWIDKSAFIETFTPVLAVLSHLSTQTCHSQLPPALNELILTAHDKIAHLVHQAQTSRRALELHHHRPLAIKTHIPKFEDSFDPHKHYDPDRERAELAKLRKEHRRERKGAMRELRRDAAFEAREKLRVKKAKDEAYEKKYKRLVAEIQGEEGREANVYKREKEQRRRANKKR